VSHRDPEYRRRRVPAVLVAFSILCSLSACSSHKTKEGVTVVRDAALVRPCSYLGRVSQTSTEDEKRTAGQLQTRVAEMGGNTLLLLAAGSGEAYSCPEPVNFQASTTSRLTPERGLVPTPKTTPRT